MSETVRPAQARRPQAAVGSRTAQVIAVQPIERFDMDLAEHSTRPTDGPRALSQEQLRRSAELVCTEGAGPEASAEQQVLSRAHAAMGRSIATLVQTNDLPSFLREMLLAAMSAVGAVTGAVARFDGLTAHHLVLRARDAWIPSEVLIAAGLHAATLDDPVAQDFLRLLPTSEAHWVTASDNGWMPAPYRSFHKDQGTPALCLVPLLIEQRLVGWIGLGFDDHRPPTGSRSALLRVLSDHITLGVEMDRLAQDARGAAVAHERALAAQQRATELARANDALRRSVARLAESRDLADFLKHMLSETILLLDGAIAQIFLYDGASHTLAAGIGVSCAGEVSAAPGLLPPKLFERPFPADITPAWQRMIATRGPIQFDLIEDAPDFWPGTMDWHRQMGHRGSVCTAMCVGNQPIGVLGMAFLSRGSLTAAEVEFVQVIAQQAALAIQTERFSIEAERTAVLRERAIAEQGRMQEMARANASFQRVSSCLVEGTPLEVFLAAVLAEITANSSARSAAVFLFDETTRALQMKAFVCDIQAVDIASDPRMSPWRGPLPGGIVERWVLALQGKDYLCHDNTLASTRQLWAFGQEVHVDLAHLHAVDMPLLAGGQLIGILAQYFCSDHRVARFDYPPTRALAHLAALAAQQQQLSDSARRASMLRERERAERERVVALARSNEALRISIDALAEANADEAFMQRSLLQITAHAGADRGYLFRSDGAQSALRLMGIASGGVFSLQAQPGEPPMFQDGLPPETPLAHQLGDGGRLLWRPLAPAAANAPDLPDLPDSARWQLREGQRAQAQHVLLVGNRRVGLVGLMFKHADPLTDTQRELVHALCQPLTLALELSRLAKLAQRSAEKAAVLTERNRLAREIHDGIAQSFLGILMRLATAAGKPLDMAGVSQALVLARHGLTEARRAVAALRPRELLSQELPSALQQLLKHMTTGAEVVAVLERPPQWQPLPVEVEDQLFRIVQEAVNNVLKHAQAKNVRVELSQAAGEATVLVVDDGSGFDAQSAGHRPGFGLEGMQQRAQVIGARVDCFSQSGKGTQVLVSWSAHAARACLPE